MQHPKKERTFVILKPDTIQRSLVGEIIQRIERVGLKIVAMKMTMATADMIKVHYNKDDAWYTKKGTGIVENRKKLGLPIEKEVIEYGRDIINALVKFMSCSPVICLVIEGNQAVAVVKKLVGSTEPTTSDVGTIRGDYTLDSYFLCDTDGGRGMRNLVHCTDDVSESEREINVWFKKEEIMNYRLVQEAMLYDVNLDGLAE